MIRGIGVDIIEIDRIKHSIEKSGEGFTSKLFTPEEIAYCEAKAFPFQHFAARFAAKEAMSKALATGWAGEFRWKDVEVSNDKSGKPSFRFHGKLSEQMSGNNVHVSLSHSESHVVAMVVVEGGT